MTGSGGWQEGISGLWYGIPGLEDFGIGYHSLRLPRHTFRVRNNKFYVTLGEHESDIWVVDLE